ncbi:MAG: LysM domain-containing protein [Pseudomonadota bacterium]
MSARFMMTGSVLLLAACSTVPNNPNYEYSSKYGQPGTDVVQTVQAEPMAAPAPAPMVVTAAHPYEPVSPTAQAFDADRMTGTPGYEAMMAQNAPIQNPPVQPAPVPLYAAPQASSQPAPVPLYAAPQTAAPAPGGAREVTYDYGQNMIVSETGRAVAAAPTQAAPLPGTAANIAVGQSYVVQPGDTVYSLSRRLCAPIGEIMTANGIGGNFAISIGQTLSLPNSRC